MFASLRLSSGPVPVGIVGCGNICGIYITNAQRLGVYEVACVHDLSEVARTAVAERYGVRACGTLGDLLGSGIEAVINLTPPAAHAVVARAAIDAGLHVYNEKPLAVELDDAVSLVAAAEAAGVRLGCAPDTYLGASLQLALGMIANGVIGAPRAAVAHMAYAGPDRWHPTPHLFFQRGAGPLFDMGPYYITALVAIGGPVRRVAALAAMPHAERVPPVGPLAGQEIPVGTPTHVSATLEHASGMVSTVVMSFDAGPHRLPEITVFGEDGTMEVPDPNNFHGTVRVHGRHAPAGSWQETAAEGELSQNSRGLGVAALLLAAQHGVDHPASAELALHVLEVMTAALRSAELGSAVAIERSAGRMASWAAFCERLSGAAGVSAARD